MKRSLIVLLLIYLAFFVSGVLLLLWAVTNGALEGGIGSVSFGIGI
jgi:hypothetical protein